MNYVSTLIDYIRYLWPNFINKEFKVKLNHYGGQALWFPIASLTSIGWIFVYSSSSVYAGQKFGDQFLFLKKQLLYSLLGACVSFFITKIEISRFYRMSSIFFYASLLMTYFATLSKFGKKVYGASRWINFGFIQIQPSEILKISTVLYIAQKLTKKNGDISLLFQISFALIALLLQPDFGSSVIILGIVFCMFLIHGFPLRYFAFAFALLIPVISLLIFNAPYRLKRLLSFLDPFADPLGSGFQVIQSLVAISSGGWLGKGLGGSQLKLFFLPESHTDFIFSVICEEIGYIGILIIIFIYTLFIWTLIDLLIKTKNQFCRLISSGFLSIFFSSFLINICVTLGLVPTKGLPLPFISYGGSSLLSYFIMMGILGRVYFEEHEVV